MATFNYENTAATALRLLTKFGAETTLTHIAPGTYDPATATDTPTETVDTVQACVFPYGDKFVDGTLIQAKDQQAYVSAGGTEPKPGAVLLWGGKELTVVKAKNLGPAGTMVLFEMQVRAQ